MLAMVRYLRTGGRLTLGEETVGGLRLVSAALWMPEGLSPRRQGRRLERAGRLLRRAGVGRLILPEDFPPLPLPAGLVPVDPLPFYRAHADLLALGYLKLLGVEPAGARVALAGPRLCPELDGAARRLCPLVRRLAIRVPGAGEEYARRLHREYGLPVEPEGRADVTVRFGPVPGPGEGALSLFSGGLCLGGLWLEAGDPALPEGYGGALPAALWERGLLDRRRLRVTAGEGK